MTRRFTMVGSIEQIEEPRESQATGLETVLVHIGDEDGLCPVLLQGKLAQLVREQKVQVGDKVYLEGRIRKDKTFSINSSSKSVVLFFAAYISVLSF